MYLSFLLSPEFVNSYAGEEVPWGFPLGGGNSLGEVTYLRTYARPIDPEVAAHYGWSQGRKEAWFQCLTRVINGMYSLQKDHCLANGLDWSDEHAERSAERAFDSAFRFHWSPPGRGLWTMGTRFVHERGEGAALNNCGFVSTGDHRFIEAAAWLMEASMLGVGVGFDTLGVGEWVIQAPDATLPNVVTIADTREGWAQSVATLLTSYLEPGHAWVEFDYSCIREKGEDIAGFGGKASGPQPLYDLHCAIRGLFADRAGEPLNTVDINDVMNLVGRCVVAGNVRRSAEIALGEYGDKDFLRLKDASFFPERNDWATGWGHLANNTIRFRRDDIVNYDEVVSANLINGEPGGFYLDTARDYGRLVDPPNFKDVLALGTNPCGEQTLESFELCCLVETYPTNCADLDEYQEAIKFAYLYSKAVTLATTSWDETNAVMARNRRIGTSMSGLAQFVDERSLSTLKYWADSTYGVVQKWDTVYSAWLNIPRSIKTTSIKPSGTVSLLAGVTPGVHWPVHDTYIRRMRFEATNPLVTAARDAGYHVEPDVKDPNTLVVEFPVRGPVVRTQTQVPVTEKLELAAAMQRYWADNQVSVTITFRDSEKHLLAGLLAEYEHKLKSWSLLPIWEGGDDAGYAQLPYEHLDIVDYQKAAQRVTRMDLSALYLDETEAIGEKYCTTDVCELPSS